MKKTTELSNNIPWKIPAAAVLISAAFFIVRVCFGGIWYETNDDMFLNLIAVGGFSEQGSQYLVYNNILYGLFLKGLYRFLPFVNWYLAVFLAASFFGIVLVSLALYRMSGKTFAEAVFWTACVNWLLGLNLYNSLQWTKNAAFYTAAAYVLMILYLYRGERKCLGLSVLYLFLAIGIRWDCFLLLSPFGLAGLLYVCWNDPAKKEVKRRGLVTALTLFLTAGILLTCQAFAYRSQEWKDYKKYWSVMRDVLDHSDLEYEEHSEEFQKAGISETDINMLRHWNFYDTEYFTEERMEQIAKIYGVSHARLRFGFDVFRDTAKMIVSRIRTYRLSRILAVMILLGFIFIKNRKLKLLLLGYVVVLFGEYWYFTSINRVLWRTEVGIWVIFFLLLALFGVNECGIPKENKAARTVLLCLAAGLFLLDSWQLVSKREEAKQMLAAESAKATEAFHMEIHKDPGRFFLGDDFSTRPSVFDIRKINMEYEKYMGLNYLSLGGWSSPSPLTKELRNRYGITNPIRCLLERDDIYLASDETDAKIISDYIREHYGEDCIVRKTEEIEGIPVWECRKEGK